MERRRLPTNLSVALPRPVYINELLHHYTPCRSIRSIDSNLLVIPKTATVTYGDRSFAAIAPKIWNQLPLIIRQSTSVDGFKRALKTYLFRETFFFSHFYFL